MRRYYMDAISWVTIGVVLLSAFIALIKMLRAADAKRLEREETFAILLSKKIDELTTKLAALEGAILANRELAAIVKESTDQAIFLARESLATAKDVADRAILLAKQDLE